MSDASPAYNNAVTESSDITGRDVPARPARQVEPAPPGPLRVGWLARSGTLERLGRILESLSVGLVDELIDLTAFCPEGADVGGLSSPPVEIVRYRPPQWWWGARAAVGQIAEVVRARKIRLLHALDAGAASLARRVARETGAVYLVSSDALGDGRQLGTLKDPNVGVLAASEAVRGDLDAHHVARPERIHLVRPGAYQVSGATCFNDPEHSAAIIAGMDLSNFAAFEAALAAFAVLHERHYQCVLFVMGDGPGEKRLRTRADELGLRDVLTFVDRPPTAQLPGIFKAADIYISPAAARAVDIPCLLAICAGVPVLAARGEVSDFLRDGETALLFEQGDAAELTMKLTSLLDDRDAARGLVDSGLQYLRERHSAGAMVAQLSEIYRSSVG